MNTKPLIGINADFRPAKGTPTPSRGPMPATSTASPPPAASRSCSPVADPNDLRRGPLRLDGVVLSGCKLDLRSDPPRHGPAPGHPPDAPRREEFDRRLAKMVYEMKVPTLAIGMGMVTPQPDDRRNRLPVPAGRRPQVPLPRHRRSLPRGTSSRSSPAPRWTRSTARAKIRVNSDHHMGIDQIAPSFRVSATAMDGVVEAYCWSATTGGALGVQFHPTMKPPRPLDMQVIEAFVEGVRFQQVEAEDNILSLSNRRAACSPSGGRLTVAVDQGLVCEPTPLAATPGLLFFEKAAAWPSSASCSSSDEVVAPYCRVRCWSAPGR